MKKKWKSRFLSGVLAGTIALSTFVSIPANVSASWVKDTRTENTPYQHGYRPEDILNWSPETDTFADLQRARIPLQERNPAFAATQADPNLSSETEYFNLAADYGQFDSLPYSNEFSQHVFNFWQYIDYYASWHGLPTEESYVLGNGDHNYTYEWGTLNLPNAGYTNAAHKNGVLSLGCIFQPRMYQHYDIMLVQDENGSFPYADKLVEIAKYYGFDGYFFNMEGRSVSDKNRELLERFFAQMRKDGMYIQWYTANSNFSITSTAPFLTSATPENLENPQLRAQSVFLDYGWDLPEPIDNAKSVGLDPLKSVFGGMEAGRDRWGNNFDKFLGQDGTMQLSIASLGAEFVQVGMGTDLGNEK